MHNIQSSCSRPEFLAFILDQADAELKSAGGRVLLRYSGTEPKARLLLEGPAGPFPEHLLRLPG